MFADFETGVEGALARERFQAEIEERCAADDRFDGAVWRIFRFEQAGPHFNNCTSIKCMCVEETARWDNASDNMSDDQ